MLWDKNLAATYARDHAESHSVGLCAHYVSMAIRYGGIGIPNTPYAKDMGKSLISVGFDFASTYLDVGDIAVIQSIEGHPYGHVCIFDGNSWISDFVQRTMYPGQDYRDASPPYSIFRHA